MIFEEVRLNWKIGNASGYGSPFSATTENVRNLESWVSDCNREFGPRTHWLEFTIAETNSSEHTVSEVNSHGNETNHQRPV